jgi:hypothetical protein
MSWERIVLVTSVFLNVVLLFSLFFRTALNDLVVKALTHWWEHKEEKRKLLLELHEHMDTFASDYFFALVLLGLTERAGTTQEREEYRRKSDELSSKLENTHTFMRKHKLEFPNSIAARLERLRKEMLLPNVESFQDGRIILERSEAVNQITQDVREEIARLVGSAA